MRFFFLLISTKCDWIFFFFLILKIEFLKRLKHWKKNYISYEREKNIFSFFSERIAEFVNTTNTPETIDGQSVSIKYVADIV